MAYHYHNAKGRPTSSKERERAPEASRERHTHHILFKKGPPLGPRARGSCRHNWWSNLGAMVVVFPLSRSRLGIDRLETPLGIDESLAFRAFDKTIIFRHWLSKTQKLALAFEAFLLKNAYTIS